MRQQWSKGLTQFEERYKDLLEYLKDKELLIIPPLLMGEDITNKWNISLTKYNDIIKELSKSYSNTSVIDVRTQFIKELADKTISKYMPMKLMGLFKDVNSLKTTEQVDNKSKERGLHLMLDGIHINSKAARIISDMIIKGL